jgi:hypothetical protein
LQAPFIMQAVAVAVKMQQAAEHLQAVQAVVVLVRMSQMVSVKLATLTQAAEQAQVLIQLSESQDLKVGLEL